MAPNTFTSRTARNWSGITSATARAEALPTKPVCAAHEVATWNATRHWWEVRPKDTQARRRAGLQAEPTQPAAAASTTTPNTEPIDLTGTTSTSSTNGDSEKENSPRHRQTTTAAAVSSRNPATTISKGSVFAPVLFRPNNAGIAKRRANTDHPVYPKTPAQQGVIAERQKQQRRYERTRIDKMREGVDERLLACNLNLHRRETSEEDEKSAKRQEEVYQMAKKLTKRGSVDAPKATGWGSWIRR